MPPKPPIFLSHLFLTIDTPSAAPRRRTPRSPYFPCFGGDAGFPQKTSRGAHHQEQTTSRGGCRLSRTPRSDCKLVAGSLRRLGAAVHLAESTSVREEFCCPSSELPCSLPFPHQAQAPGWDMVIYDQPLTSHPSRPLNHPPHRSCLCRWYRRGTASRRCRCTPRTPTCKLVTVVGCSCHSHPSPSTSTTQIRWIQHHQSRHPPA